MGARGEVGEEEGSHAAYLPASAHSSSGFSHGSQLWLYFLSPQPIWGAKG